MEPDITEDCIAVLRALAVKKNVLISGPPGTGKSRLLAEIALAFENAAPEHERRTTPFHDAGAKIPIPATKPYTDERPSALPSPLRKQRKVFRTAFHQGSKYRDFLTGIVPVVEKLDGAQQAAFRVSRGTLYQASEHAKTADGASLLIIDEINRGPAIQIFGGSIVAIESDKRLAADGAKREETQFFEIIDPKDGSITEYALPADLYIVGAMNQADASIEPLDVAFLRRWVPFRLEPDANVLRRYFSLGERSDLPEVPEGSRSVYEAAVQAWEAINRKLSVGRGAEYQIGHGVLMNGPETPPEDQDEALFLVSQAWKSIRAHIDEVFFGDIIAIAEALNAVNGPKGHIYTLEEVTFANEPRTALKGPSSVGPDEIYALLRTIIG